MFYRKIINITLFLLPIVPACQAQQDTTAQYKEAVNYIFTHTKEIQKEWVKIFDRHERKSMANFEDRSFCISRMICYKDIVEFSPQAIDSAHTKIKMDPGLFNEFRLIDPNLYGQANFYQSFLSPVLDTALCCTGEADPAHLTLNFSKPVRNYMTATLTTATLKRSACAARLHGRILLMLFVYDENNKISSVFFSWIIYE